LDFSFSDVCVVSLFSMFGGIDALDLIMTYKSDLCNHESAQGLLDDASFLTEALHASKNTRDPLLTTSATDPALVDRRSTPGERHSSKP
jgi:hypothetical protein